MKKYFLTLLLTLLIGLSFTLVSLAQKSQHPPVYDILFDLAVSDSLKSMGTAYNSVAISVGSINDGKGLGSNHILSQKHTMKTPIMLGVKLKQTTNYRLRDVKSFTKTYTAYRLIGSSVAEVIALGINKTNVDDYRYRVVINDSVEVVHWSKIPRLEQKYGAKKPYGFIGYFNYPDKEVLVEVVNIKNYQLRDGIIFDWRKNLTPVITNFLFQSEMSYREGKKLGRQTQAPHTIKYNPATGIPSDIRFTDSVTEMSIFFKEHESIAYQVSLFKVTNGIRESYGGAWGDDVGTKFDLHLTNYPKGDWEIIVTPLGFDLKDQQIRIPFKILPSSKSVLEKKASLKELLPFFIITLIIGGLLFWLYKRRANIKLARSIQAKQNVNLKLRSIRSQLNPHFMFNALTSIQNLVNKKDMDGANHYLSRFADLTRKVLNTGEHDLISLDDEINILDDYLQMEQLRFNFKYDITVDVNLNRANIDVPAMLLQPFVENAVKHGVASQREKGLVNMQINNQDKNLVFIISDNGSGFKQNSGEVKNDSFGLKLTEERIELLNQVYKDQPVILNIQTAGTGTIITITLTNWI